MINQSFLKLFQRENDRQSKWQNHLAHAINKDIRLARWGMGTSLSGGQKQRIVLARALYREPRILFMDEATSHLDVTNESLINERIKALNITRVLVAHRPETVDSAGRKIKI